MLAHRKAFPTPRGATGGCPPEHICGGRPHGPREGGKGDPEGGKGDPEGGVERPPDVVAHRLWCHGTTARHAPNRKPLNAVTIGVYLCRLVLMGTHNVPLIFSSFSL